jgi:transposase-like protein
MQGSSSSNRWTADDRIRIVMESLTTNITLAELCRKYNLIFWYVYGVSI